MGHNGISLGEIGIDLLSRRIKMIALYVTARSCYAPHIVSSGQATKTRYRKLNRVFFFSFLVSQTIRPPILELESKSFTELTMPENNFWAITTITTVSEAGIKTKRNLDDLHDL